MIQDFSIIEDFYNSLPSRITAIRKHIDRPLTLTEKILYTHLFPGEELNIYRRGLDYANFNPDRVAMQDATAQMTLLQFMITGRNHSSVPASVHCDHLITANSGAEQDLKTAREINSEVYDFLKSACGRYGISFWKPGSGIIHQIVLENYAFPGGLMTGTDSHTPNAGGLGMMAVGVGGADAVDALTGCPWELRFPQITGVKLTGRLNKWVSAKDVILKIAGMVSVSGFTNSVVEYFGDGAESLSCTGKATICNMGAETGATASLFGFDEAMASYLEATGRKEIADIARINRKHLVADEEVYTDPAKYYDRLIEIDLGKLVPHINGPYSPDISTPVPDMKQKAAANNWPVDAEVVMIGSCTNSSFEDIARAASVVKDALSKKLVLKSILLIIPGSEQVLLSAEESGYMELFRKAGAEILANACGPCIGQWNRKDSVSNRPNTIIHTFNRNFAKRTDGNPDTHVFITSPEMAVAIAFSGKVTFNPFNDKLVNGEGSEVLLCEPNGPALPPGGFVQIGRESIGSEPVAPVSTIKIDPHSQRLQALAPLDPWDGKDFINIPLLIKAKGKCTTDHISMAGPWLKYRGHLENISENYMTGAVNYFNGLSNSVFNQLTGDYDSVPATAKAYRNSGIGSVVAGEENFGEGSSREHAAMEPRFLAVRAIIVKSFARIHETNLKKQGILTLTFHKKSDYDKIREDDKADITGLKDFSPLTTLSLTLNHSDGTKENIPVTHTYNEIQISWYKAGGALNIIRNSETQK
ncbi:MAG: aconitate hydratase [Bacteroidota bacterium]